MIFNNYARNVHKKKAKILRLKLEEKMKEIQEKRETMINNYREAGKDLKNKIYITDEEFIAMVSSADFNALYHQAYALCDKIMREDNNSMTYPHLW